MRLSNELAVPGRRGHDRVFFSHAAIEDREREF